MMVFYKFTLIMILLSVADVIAMAIYARSSGPLRQLRMAAGNLTKFETIWNFITSILVLFTGVMCVVSAVIFVVRL